MKLPRRQYRLWSHISYTHMSPFHKILKDPLNHKEEVDASDSHGRLPQIDMNKELFLLSQAKALHEKKKNQKKMIEAASALKVSLNII